MTNRDITTWVERVSINDFITEMRRKPNAGLLLDWINARAARGIADEDDDEAILDAKDALLDIEGMVAVYVRAIEESRRGEGEEHGYR